MVLMMNRVRPSGLKRFESGPFEGRGSAKDVGGEGDASRRHILHILAQEAPESPELHIM